MVNPIAETRYTASADGLHIAYAVGGDGPPDLVYIGDWLGNVDAAIAFEEWRPFWSGLANIGRFVLFDPRGTGASDPAPVGEPATLDHGVDDLRAVLDATGSQAAFLFAHAQATPVATLFAAAHPERTAGLVLWSPFAALIDRDGDGVGFPAEMRDQLVEFNVAGVGNPQSDWAQVAMPGAGRERDREAVARFQRFGASPATVRALTEMYVDFDIRDVLPSVQAPTLVLQRSGDRLVHPRFARQVAALIPNASYVELVGDDHFPVHGDIDAALAEIAEFVTGERPAPDPQRVLATLLFTDIVGSTDRAARMGDRAWRDVLDRHHEVACREVDVHRGRVVKSTGDGLLAVFDGPGRAVHCAQAIIRAVADLDLDIRAGIHTGEIELMGDDVGGIAVHIAARVSALARASEVLVSRTVVDLMAGSGVEFADRGEVDLRGVPGRWQVFALRS